MITRLFKQGIGFRCIGSKCIDSCCTGWDISFDKTTYEHLSNDSRFIDAMTSYAYINEDGAIPSINHGILNLNEKGNCPFLDGDALCRIQKISNEESLSNVCALYPRYYNLIGDTYEESLSLDCIEAAEKLLLEGPLDLTEIKRPPKRELVLQTIGTDADDKGIATIQYLYDFRQLVFGLLKETHYSLDEKLGTLMAFHQDIEGLEGRQLESILKSYDFSHRKMSLDTGIHTYKKIVDLLKRVGLSEHPELDTLIRQCIQTPNFKALSLKSLTSLNQIMSNYLIHQMYKDLYPFIGMKSKMASFQYLLKKVQILRLLIASDGSLDDKRIVRIIQLFSKGLEHHGAFYYELENLFL